MLLLKHCCIAASSVVLIAIAVAFMTCKARWIGSKRIELQLPPHTNVSKVLFYECYGTLDDLVTSRTTEDFRRIDRIAYTGDGTVTLALTTTGVDYPLFDWFDVTTEPTFILAIIEDSTGLVTEKLFAQNTPGPQTSPTVALAVKPSPSDAPQPRSVLYFNGQPIPRGGVIRGVIR
jgi:hypothetical protein